jgi:hypothetical protein
MNGTRPRRSLRLLLLASGIALAVYCVWSVGAESVASVVRRAGQWLPVIAALELGIVVTDLLGLRALLGGASRDVSVPTWTRAMALAYGVGVVMPGGRAAGEAARAATLASDVTVASAGRASARMQVSALAGNAIASAILAPSVVHTSTTLAWALASNAVLCGGLAGALILLVRSRRFASLLRRVLRPLLGARAEERAHAPPSDRTTSATSATSLAVAVLMSSLGRVVQTLQYGVAVHAVGGQPTVAHAAVAEGIHLVGATVGDALPNQIGATESAYKLFASSLQLDAARALSIALVVRFVQLVLGAAALLVAALVPVPPGKPR